MSDNVRKTVSERYAGRVRETLSRSGLRLVEATCRRASIGGGGARRAREAADETAGGVAA